MAKANKPDHNTQLINESFHHFAEEHEAIRNKYRVSYKLKKSDLKDWPRGKVGDIIYHNPEIPDNPEEAFELFRNYYASVQFVLQKHLFLEKYKVWNKASVSAEIKEIERWIEEAKKKNYTDAVKPISSHIKEYQYLLLLNGYYDGYLMTWSEHQETSTAAHVYGRYFLFYDYLKDKLANLQYPANQYMDKIEIDFEDLPKYVIEQGILQRFEKIRHVLDIHQPNYFTDWDREYRSYFKTIPNEYIVKTIQKGIEYAKKVYNYHIQNECKKKDECLHNESWERKIALAENFMNSILKEHKPTREDFSKWIMMYPAWREIAWRYNTGKEYQHKQDLIAVFWNSYVYIQDKFEGYYEEFQVIPKDYFEKLIFEFRQSFPKTDRVKGVNYYDDLIEQLIDRYEKIAVKTTQPEIENEESISLETNKEFTTTRQVLAVHYLLDYCDVRGIDSTAKARFIQFLTGKEIGAANIKNTTIYKRVRSPFVKNDKKLVEDLQFIRKYFEELGLKEIAESITKEINTKTD